jgi:hypothetical protein
MQIQNRKYNLYANDDGRVVCVSVNMRDDIHHYNVHMEVDMETGEINRIITQCIKSPYPTCKGVIERIKGLRGQSVFGGAVRAIKDNVGGSSGCHRLFELLVMIANHAWAYITNPSDILQIDLARPELQNSCLALQVN